MDTLSGRHFYNNIRLSDYPGAHGYLDGLEITRLPFEYLLPQYADYPNTLILSNDSKGVGMSLPQSILINKKTEVIMDKAACLWLYGYLEPLFIGHFGEESDFTGRFAASDCFGRLEINFLDQPAYQTVCRWILEAATGLEVVQPYREEPKAALDADPKFDKKAA